MEQNLSPNHEKFEILYKFRAAATAWFRLCWWFYLCSFREVLSCPLPRVGCWLPSTSWSFLRTSSVLRFTWNLPVAFYYPPRKQNRVVSGTAKSPEHGLTAVNDNNDHQSNAEEFREEKGTFQSLLSEELILSLTSGWAHMSYRSKTSATRKLHSQPPKKGPPKKAAAHGCLIPALVKGKSELSLRWMHFGSTPQPRPRCQPSRKVSQALGHLTHKISLTKRYLFYICQLTARIWELFMNDIWLVYFFFYL